MTSDGMRRFTLGIGDSSRVVQPGATIGYCVIAQSPFQLRGLRGTEYVEGRSAPARWPVVACYAGDEVISGPQALYDDETRPITCQRGQQITLTLRNPLLTPAAWCGALIGVAYRRVDLASVCQHVWVHRNGGVVRSDVCGRCGAKRVHVPQHVSCGGVYPEEIDAYPDGARPLTAEELQAALHRVEQEAQHTAKIERAVEELSRIPREPRRIFYCEAAPSREVVEAATCLLDGDEVGGVPRMPYLKTRLYYTARMQIEWERHRDHEERWQDIMHGHAQADRVDAAVIALGKYAGKNDWEIDPPGDTDTYGGKVLVAPASGRGARCALCGAWLRVVEVR